jgi:hypothetical protein
MRAELLTREHARVARRNLEDALKKREPLQGFVLGKLIRL